MGSLIDLTGQQFGRLTVIERSGVTKQGRAAWLCRCDCGNTKIVSSDPLRRNQTRSCGCLRKEQAVVHGKTINLRHGCDRKGKPTSEYTAWASMIQRCENPNASGYENYGGRGIQVCLEWRHDFKKFLDDMGVKPSSQHSLDRIDVDGDYTADNCRWATKTTQSRNVRISCANSSGTKGVQRTKDGKFVATIGVHGESIFLGRFDNALTAAKARKDAEFRYWGDGS